MLRHSDYNNRLISIVSLFSGTLCILLSVLGFPFALNMEARNLVKDEGFLCLLINPRIFDEGRLFPKKFSRQSEIFPVACVVRKIRDLNSL